MGSRKRVGGMKNSFVLYTNYLKQVELLENEQRGILFTAILKYAAEKELPEMDGVTAMAFSFICSNIDADNEKYERTVEARKKAGSKGGKANQANASFAKQNQANQANASFAKQNDDNDNDNVNDIDNDSNKNIKVKNPDAEYQYKAVCDRLNESAGTAFRDTSKDTRKHIKARFNEGYKLEDFYAVIEKKCAEWKGTDMEKYLRPSTLFGTKFESYLNQAAKPSKMDHAKGQYDDYERDWTDHLL